MIPQIGPVLERLKLETAQELGIQGYEQRDKGDLPSRVNGSVGGYMVKKMIALAQAKLNDGGSLPFPIITQKDVE